MTEKEYLKYMQEYPSRRKQEQIRELYEDIRKLIRGSLWSVILLGIYTYYSVNFIIKISLRISINYTVRLLQIMIRTIRMIKKPKESISAIKEAFVKMAWGYLHIIIGIREIFTYILWKMYFCLFILCIIGKGHVKFKALTHTEGMWIETYFLGILLFLAYLSYLHFLFPGEAYEQVYKYSGIPKTFLGFMFVKQLLLTGNVFVALTDHFFFIISVGAIK